VSRLRGRVASQQYQGSGGYEEVSGGQASPGGTPMVMPLQRVVVGPTVSQYVTVGMEDLAPLWTTDGAPVAASGGGGWGQLAVASGPHPGRQRPWRAPLAGG
jgi:hypothetical protein